MKGATRTKEDKVETEIMSGKEIGIDTMIVIATVDETTIEIVKEDMNAEGQEAEKRTITMIDTEIGRHISQRTTDKSPSSCCRKKRSR